MLKMKSAAEINRTVGGSNISSIAIAKFMQDAQKACAVRGEEDTAFRFECLAQYFEKDYNPDGPLKFKLTMIGM